MEFGELDTLFFKHLAQLVVEFRKVVELLVFRKMFGILQIMNRLVVVVGQDVAKGPI